MVDYHLVTEVYNTHELLVVCNSLWNHNILLLPLLILLLEHCPKVTLVMEVRHYTDWLHSLPVTKDSSSSWAILDWCLGRDFLFFFGTIPTGGSFLLLRIVPQAEYQGLKGPTGGAHL